MRDCPLADPDLRMRYLQIGHGFGQINVTSFFVVYGFLCRDELAERADSS